MSEVLGASHGTAQSPTSRHAWRSRTVIQLLSSLFVLALALTFFGVPAGATSGPAPKLAHPTVTGQTLVTRFFVLLKDKDAPGLNRFLSPAFQIVRADGTSSGKTSYLANLPIVESFTIENVAATQAASVLVVRYMATATGLVNGKPYTPGPAPRLSVFVWNGTRWQLTAHANFNPLSG